MVMQFESVWVDAKAVVGMALLAYTRHLIVVSSVSVASWRL